MLLDIPGFVCFLYKFYRYHISFSLFRYNDYQMSSFNSTFDISLFPYSFWLLLTLTRLTTKNTIQFSVYTREHGQDMIKSWHTTNPHVLIELLRFCCLIFMPCIRWDSWLENEGYRVQNQGCRSKNYKDL